MRQLRDVLTELPPPIWPSSRPPAARASPWTQNRLTFSVTGLNRRLPSTSRNLAQHCRDLSREVPFPGRTLSSGQAMRLKAVTIDDSRLLALNGGDRMNDNP